VTTEDQLKRRLENLDITLPDILGTVGQRMIADALGDRRRVAALGAPIGARLAGEPTSTIAP